METANKSNLAKAIIKVMQSVKGIEKSMTIGSGTNSYKGVPDQEVKKVIGEAMAENGLCLLPIETTAQTKIDRWEESYNGQSPRMRQSIFTEVTTKYLLLHESGESQIISGYGHGVDSQDKGAGKATTYALKYAMLYAFLIPTGKIDDSDATHSDNIQTPASTAIAEKTPSPEKDGFIQNPIDKIKACKDVKSLTALWNSMPATQQLAEHIIDAFKVKRATFPAREQKKESSSAR